MRAPPGRSAAGDASKCPREVRVIGESRLRRDARDCSVAVGELVTRPRHSAAAGELAERTAIATSEEFCEVHRVHANLARYFGKRRSTLAAIANHLGCRIQAT